MPTLDRGWKHIDFHIFGKFAEKQIKNEWYQLVYIMAHEGLQSTPRGCTLIYITQGLYFCCIIRKKGYISGQLTVGWQLINLLSNYEKYFDESFYPSKKKKEKELTMLSEMASQSLASYKIETLSRAREINSYPGLTAQTVNQLLLSQGGCSLTVKSQTNVHYKSIKWECAMCKLWLSKNLAESDPQCMHEWIENLYELCECESHLLLSLYIRF